MATPFDPKTGLPRPVRGNLYGNLDSGIGGQLVNSYYGGARQPSIDVAGFTPDYQGLINADFKPLGDLLAAQGVSNTAGRTAMRQRALGQFGFAPNIADAAAKLGLQDFQSDITPEVQALAEQNTKAGLSTQARIDQAHQDTITQIKNALNARGLLGSGATGYALQREQNSYEQANYDATQKLLDYLSGVEQAYTGNATKIAAAQQQGLQQSAQAVRDNPANAAGPPRTLSYNAAVGGYGPDEQGNVYDANQQVIRNVNQQSGAAPKWDISGPAAPVMPQSNLTMPSPASLLRSLGDTGGAPVVGDSFRRRRLA